jgi:hypothetical protein
LEFLKKKEVQEKRKIYYEQEVGKAVKEDARESKVSVTDEEIKKYVEEYYKKTVVTEVEE